MEVDVPIIRRNAFSGPPPDAFTMIRGIRRFILAYNPIAFAWMPSLYSVEIAVAKWDVPVFRDQSIAREMYDVQVRQTSHSIATIAGKDVFLLVGRCASQVAIQDFRITAARRLPRYASMISPSLIRDDSESELRTSCALIDSATTGGPWASSGAVYFYGGCYVAILILAHPVRKYGY